MEYNKESEREFAKIVKENKSSIYTICYMFSNKEDEVNDLFQEILINLWKGYEKFEGKSKISTWIYRVAMNTCISAERKKQNRKDNVQLSMDLNLYDESEDLDTKQIQMLHKRIGKLGIIDRAIILMWLENMSYEEIAAVVGISVKNVSVKLYRIKEQLKNG